MPTLKGPCVDCGTPLEKYVRPGKQLRCLECAIGRVEAHARAMHDGTAPTLAKSIAAGYALREQVERGEGEYYERWVGGMQDYVKTLSTTKHPSAANVAPVTPTANGGRHTRSNPNGRNKR